MINLLARIVLQSKFDHLLFLHSFHLFSLLNFPHFMETIQQNNFSNQFWSVTLAACLDWLDKGTDFAHHIILASPNSMPGSQSHSKLLLISPTKKASMCTKYNTSGSKKYLTAWIQLTQPTIYLANILFGCFLDNIIP